MLATAQQDAHDLVRDLDVAVEQPAKADVEAPVFVRHLHVPDDEAHLLHLLVDMLVSTIAALGRLGAILGTAVSCVTLLQTAGHGVVVVEFLAERVQLLARHVFL